MVPYVPGVVSHFFWRGAKRSSSHQATGNIGHAESSGGGVTQARLSVITNLVAVAAGNL